MSHADLLGVPPGASREAIKKAYRAKAKICHPDAGGNPEKFRALTAAYNALLDGESTPARKPTGAKVHNPFGDFDRHGHQ